MKTRLRILLVDDDLAVLSVHSRLLRRRCARVDTATNGHEALACLARQDYDLVLCDIRMPGLDGMGVLEDAPAGTRVAFLTGFADYSIQELRNSGAYDVLSKPARLDEVLGLVERVHHEAMAA